MTGQREEGSGKGCRKDLGWDPEGGGRWKCWWSQDSHWIFLKIPLVLREDGMVGNDVAYGVGSMREVGCFQTMNGWDLGF